MNHSDNATAAARQLAARRRLSEKACAACGKPVVGLARQVFCSATCRKRAQRQRQREQRDAEEHDRAA